MSKHTPGPWKLDINNCITTSDNIHIATIWEDTHPENHANACLIAAAPDMLDALKDCFMLVQMCQQKMPVTLGLRRIRERLISIIDKAEGYDCASGLDKQ